MIVLITCAECSIPRALAMRTIFAAPSQLPAFTCRSLACKCSDPLPRILYQVPAAAWRPPGICHPTHAAPTAPTYELPDELLASSPIKNFTRANSINPPTMPQTLPTVHRTAISQAVSELSKSPSVISEATVQGRMKVTWSQLESKRKLWGEDTKRDDEAGLNPYGCVLPKPSHYIVGDPLVRFRNPDPNSEDIRLYSQSERDGTWKTIRKDFLKWLSGQKKEAYFEGKQEIAPVIEWDNMMRYYFVITPVENPITQARLAVSTFKDIAQSWWRAHITRLPHLLISYDQLLEWIKCELVPKADPAASSLAWRKLKFTGSVSDYMTQLDKLTRHFPLRHDTLVPQATDPLGEEVVALAMRADIMYGRNGMSVPQLKEFIRQHLESLSAAQRKVLAERIPYGTGYGNPEKKVEKELPRERRDPERLRELRSELETYPRSRLRDNSSVAYSHTARLGQPFNQEDGAYGPPMAYRPPPKPTLFAAGCANYA